MARFVTSKKFTGVKYEELDKKDRSYYITYKINGKTKTSHIGKRSEGITEEFCHQKRNEAINRERFGDDTPIVKFKKKTIATLDELAEIYFNDKTLHNRNNHRMKLSYQKHFSPIFGNDDIGDISSEIIEKWQRDMAKTICEHTKRTYASKTINNLLNDLSAIINHSMLKGKFKGENPIKTIKRQKVKNERQRYFTMEEIELLLNEVKNLKDGELLTIFILLSLSTGGRVKTICNIKVQDIDMINGIVSLYDYKNQSSYKGFISSGVIQRCKEWINKQNYKKLDCLISSDGKRLFTDETGTEDIKYISNRLSPVFNKLFNHGLKAGDSTDRAVPHSLRHTFASQLAINGTPIYTIQKLMNHKDISQTLRYAKLAPDTGKLAVIEMMDGLFNGGVKK
jgi:integrase